MATTLTLELSPKCKLFSQFGSSITIEELNRETRDRIGDDGSVSLLELLKGSKLVFPSNINSNPKEPNEALKKRREYLKLRAEERDYYKMSGTVSGTSAQKESVGRMLPKVSIGANMIMAMGTMFIACYVASGSVFTTETPRMVCGLAGMVLIMIVEMTLFVIRDTKMKEE